MTDARFSGGSVGLVIGHVAPEAFLGGPIALVEDGDSIVIDVDTDRIDCPQLADPAEAERRAAAWKAATETNGGVHPDVTPVKDRVLARMRATASRPCSAEAWRPRSQIGTDRGLPTPPNRLRPRTPPGACP